MKRVAISGSGGRLRAALIEDGRLREWRTEDEGSEVVVGDIYQGRVTNVLPGIQSAFVDIGAGENAYLYVDDVLPPRASQASAQSKPGISERVQVGQRLLVQVSKEGTEWKAPKVTTRIGLQGRFLVFLPQEEEVSISRKIVDATKRERLQKAVASLLGTGEGAIIRTEAAEVDEDRLATELAYLRRRWQETIQQAKGKTTPGRLCRESDLIEAALRDFTAAGVDEVWVEHAPTLEQVKAVMAVFAAEWLDRLHWYQGKDPLFSHLGVDAELNRALQRQVPLPSGGHLVIDRTEAMTVIDVNSGAFTGKGGQQREQTVTAINLEAAVEIARQLRLRDIGGIIIIDFIDMKEAANKQLLVSALKRELARDPVPSTVLGITALGLVEMTRKRTRASLAERITEPCESCGGASRVLSVEELEHRLCNEIAGLAKGQQEADAVVIELPRRLHQRIVQRADSWPARLYMLQSESHKPDEYRILYAGRVEEAERLHRNYSK